jgi:hypothetical protein
MRAIEGIEYRRTARPLQRIVQPNRYAHLLPSLGAEAATRVEALVDGEGRGYVVRQSCFDIWVYLTEGRRIAVYGANDESLTAYETFEDSDQFRLVSSPTSVTRSARRAARVPEHLGSEQ